MANLSKVKIGEVVYDLKDATSRSNLETMLGSHAVAALGAAAWLGVDTAVTENGTGVVTGGKIKEYVDAQVGSIHKFDVVVLKDAEALPTASEDTMYKIYLKPDTSAEAGTYVEYITVRSGAEGSYTYAWEAIGSTKTDLSGYVQKTQKIAGVDLQDDITAAELQTALELKSLAYADTATGTYMPAGTVSISSDAINGVDVTVVDATYTSTAAALTKGDYTPAGSVTGDAIKGGSIEVTVKDASTASQASLTYAAYTPAGSVAIAKDNENGIQISGTVSKPDVSVDDTAKDTFVKSLKAGDKAAATFTEGAFTPASITDGFFSAGSQASYEHTGFSGGSLGDASTGKFATTGLIAAVDETDTEMLVFSAAATSDAVTAQGTYTAAVYGTDNFVTNTLPSIDTTKFSGGSKAADSFSAEKIPVVDATAPAVTAVTAQLAANPTFTGDKFSASFSGTEVAQMKVTKAEYVKQEINTATFTPEAATLSFSGTKAEKILVTGVNYDKADKAVVEVVTTDANISATFDGDNGDVTVTAD